MLKERESRKIIDLLKVAEFGNFSSLDKMQEHFIHLYSRRNDVYLADDDAKLNLLFLGMSGLYTCVRKDLGNEEVGTNLARVVSRIFCVAQGKGNISVSQGMVTKYPFEGCSYCKHQECACEEKRPDADLSFGSSDKQKEWSLRDFQQHLKNVYGVKNKQKGIEYINNRLMNEYGEIVSVIKNIPKMTDMDEIEKELQLELADCLAWAMAVANFYNIDLQNEVEKRYGDGCRKCEYDRCACGPHDFFPIDTKVRKAV